MLRLRLRPTPRPLGSGPLGSPLKGPGKARCPTPGALAAGALATGTKAQALWWLKSIAFQLQYSFCKGIHKAPLDLFNVGSEDWDKVHKLEQLKLP